MGSCDSVVVVGIVVDRGGIGNEIFDLRLDIRPRGPLFSAEGVGGEEFGCGFQGRGGEGGGSEGFEGVGHFFLGVGCVLVV